MLFLEEGEMLQVGEEVVWQSASNGTVAEKRGTVLAVLEPGTPPLVAFYHLKDQNPALRFTYGGGLPRDKTSYLIALHSKTPKAKTVKVYWPNVSALCRVADEPVKKSRGKAKTKGKRK